MTDTTTYALPLMTVPRAHGKTASTTRRDQTLTPPDDHADGWGLFGLTLLTLPAAIYSLTQMWSHLASGALDQAVRAFLP